MNAFELFAVLKLNKDSFEKGLRSAEGTAKDSGSKLEGALRKVGTVAKGIAVGTAAAVGAAGVGLAKITKEAVAGYAEYEQLVGGVEKLFGNSAKTVQKYADEAYKTAGLSANEYMETVTNFSASLISSLGNDTAKAAEYADMALRDMSDNANVFGSDMGMIQNAYQGFAKQNYTMLDNLKLGYGGTKTEMERLIADANKLKVAQGGVADLTIERYSDVIEAIHLVQGEMKITGTTQKEAAKTIEGSINSTKAAWKNFITGLGNSNADIKKLAKNVIDSASNVVDNIIPIVQNVAEAIPEAITAIANKLPSLAKSLLPAIKKTVTALIDGLLNNLGDVLDIVLDIVIELVDYLIDNLPTIIDKVFDMIARLVESIARRLPELVPKLIVAIVNLIPTIITGIAEAVFSGISGLIEGITGQVDVFGIEAARKLKETRQRISDNIDSWKELKEAELEGIGQANQEAGQLTALWQELQQITDENGKVKKGMEDRASFIVGTLNDALGTEIELNGNIVQGMKDIENEIDNLIAKKRAQAVLEVQEEAYNEAMQNRSQMYEDIIGQQERVNQAIAEEEKIRSGQMAGPGMALYLEQLKTKTETEKATLAEMQATYDGYYDTIAGYEQAYGEFQKGEYEKVQGVIDSFGQFFSANLREKKAQLEQSITYEQEVYDKNKEMYKSTQDDMYKTQMESSKVRLNDLKISLADTEKAITEANAKMIADQEKTGDSMGEKGHRASLKFKEGVLSQFPSLQSETNSQGAEAGKQADTGMTNAMDPAGIMENYKQGFIIMRDQLATALYNVGFHGGEALNQGVRDATKERSPSRAAMEIVDYFAQGAIIQMGESAKDLYKGAYAMGLNINAGLEEAVKMEDSIYTDEALGTLKNGEIKAQITVADNRKDEQRNGKLDAILALLGQIVPLIDRPIYLDGEKVSANMIDRITAEINSEVIAYA